MPPSDPPTVPEPPQEPEPTSEPKQRHQPGQQSHAGSADDVPVRLDDLAAELTGLRTETRSELGHIGRLIRAEGLGISQHISSEFAQITGHLTSEHQLRVPLTRRYLVIANLASVSAIAVLLRLML